MVNRIGIKGAFLISDGFDQLGRNPIGLACVFKAEWKGIFGANYAKIIKIIVTI